MSKELKKILDDPNKKLAEARNALAHLFRKILGDRSINAKEWDALITSYLKGPLSRTPNNAKDIGQDKNNLNRALAKNTITFNNFIKALMIMRPTRIKITISMDWKRKRGGDLTTVHETSFINPVAQLDLTEEEK